CRRCRDRAPAAGGSAARAGEAVQPRRRRVPACPAIQIASFVSRPCPDLGDDFPSPLIDNLSEQLTSLLALFSGVSRLELVPNFFVPACDGLDLAFLLTPQPEHGRQ